MPSTIFQLTPSDLQKKIVPRNGAHSFLIDDASGDMTEAEALDIINASEDRVMMRLPQRYRRLVKRVEGEVVVDYAEDGQTSIQLGLYPVTAGTLRLYVDYELLGKSWEARRPTDRLADAGFSLTAATGEVTLTTSLRLGQRVFAEYDHTAASKLLGLKAIVLSLAAVEVSREYSYFSNAEGFDRFEQWNNDAYSDLKNMTGIDLLDNLKLLFETDGDPYEYIRRL